MTVSVVSAGSAYEIRLNGVVDQDGVVPLAVGAGNVIAVVVTAQDGESSQTYTVMVTRAGSADASLSALSLSGVTLMPAFASGTVTYTASVATSVMETTVSATAVAGAAYEVRLNGVVDQDGVVPLVVGSGNVIEVVVTAQDGEGSQTYTVTVTRAGVSGRYAEWAFANGGWWGGCCAVAGVCVGDDGLWGDSWLCCERRDGGGDGCPLPVFRQHHSSGCG